MTLIGYVSTRDHAQWGGPCRYIQVTLHDTTEQLQKAATRYRGGDWTNAGGGFHPAPHKERHVDGQWVRTDDPHWAGVMRLSRELLATEVVAHECIHAAAAIYRMDVATSIALGNGCGHREETFAYIAGHLTHGVTNVLHEMGAWG